MRRLPWVTFAVMAACLLALLATSGAARQAEAAGATAHEQLAAAFEHWSESPHLALDERLIAELDDETRSYVEELRKEVAAPEDFDADELAEEQAALDAEVEAALAAIAAAKAGSPYLAWGLTPGSIGVLGLFTHMFMHAGWMHLLGNLFMLFMAGPALEDRWGRPLYAGFYVAAGLASGLFFAALSRDPSLPLVGASGAIAGVFGAFLVRLWSTEIRFWYLLWFGLRFFRGTFDSPAWVMLPLWFANEVFQAWLSNALGVTSGVAYEAHIGGFLFGVAAALAVKASRYEERVVDAAIEEKITVRGNAAVAEALALRDGGDLRGAVQKLAAEVQRQPRDSDAVDAYWDACVASGCAGDAAHAVVALAQRELSSNQAARAAQRFIEVYAALPDYGFDPAFVVRLVPQLRAFDREHAVAALHWLAARERGALAPTLAQRAVEEARALDAAVAKQLARRFAEADLPQPMRERFAALARELQAEAPDERPQEATDLELAEARTPEAAFRAHALAVSDEEEAGWEAGAALGPLIEESAALPRFSGIKVTEANPLALTESALSMALDGGKKGQLALAKVEGVALAAVRGLSAKPVILVDLLVGWRGLEGGSLRCVRLRSDRFDPRTLAPGEQDPLTALRAFVAALVERSGATPLAAADPAAGVDALTPHPDLASYERAVLEVGA